MARQCTQANVARTHTQKRETTLYYHCYRWLNDSGLGRLEDITFRLNINGLNRSTVYRATTSHSCLMWKQYGRFGQREGVERCLLDDEASTTHRRARTHTRTHAHTHTRTHAHTHTRTHAHTHTRTHAHTHTRTHAHTHTRTHAHTHTRTHAHTHTRTHAHTRACAHARTHARTRTHIHTHAHTDVGLTPPLTFSGEDLVEGDEIS